MTQKSKAEAPGADCLRPRQEKQIQAYPVASSHGVVGIAEYAVNKDGSIMSAFHHADICAKAAVRYRRFKGKAAAANIKLQLPCPPEQRNRIAMLR